MMDRPPPEPVDDLREQQPDPDGPSDYVTCPICGGTDMPRLIEPHEDGGYITCHNLDCGSNGGDNFNALPAGVSQAVIEECAQIAEEYAGEQGYHAYFARYAGNDDAAMFYHKRSEMLCVVAARIRSKISSQHVLDMALTRPGMKRWTDLILKDQLERHRMAPPPGSEHPATKGDIF